MKDEDEIKKMLKVMKSNLDVVGIMLLVIMLFQLLSCAVIASK